MTRFNSALRIVALVAVTAVVASGTTAWAAATFSDVPSTHPFAEDIEWMAAAGISEGYADGTFRPGAPVTRQAMSAFMHRQSDFLMAELFPSPLTVGAVEFVPNNDATEYFFDDDTGVFMTTTTFCAQAPVRLPDGATVTTLRLLALDQGSGDVSIKLRRAGITSSGAAQDMTATLASTGTGATVRTFTTPVLAGTQVIDNSQFVYQVTMCQNPTGTQVLRAAQIDFTPPTT